MRLSEKMVLFPSLQTFLLLQRAKGPKSNKAESFLLACRRKEEERLKYLEFAKLHSKGCEISQWEKHNECKRLHSTVRKKVAETMQEYLAGTEDRRER